MKDRNIKEAGSTAVVQGFGNVGSIAALELYNAGLKIIAVSDAFGGIHNAKGLDLNLLEEHLQKTRSVVGFAEAEAVGQRARRHLRLVEIGRDIDVAH